MLYLSTEKAIDNAVRILLHQKNVVKPNRWQGVKIDSDMKEVDNIFIQMEMCQSFQELAKQTKADLPWAEDHFQERLAGPSNPGEQYKHWPHWKPDAKYMEGQIFSHTYQERFWPEKKEGIRYDMGNWEDIKQRMSEDPGTRQAFFSIWHPEDQSNDFVRRLPCTIGYWFKINNNQLDVTYLIRSCDARRHLRNDVYMTQRLAADMYDYLIERKDFYPYLKFGKMTMWIGSLHCFVSDEYSLKQKLK